MNFIVKQITRVKSAEKEKKTRSLCVSLDGLLDYEEEDRDEGTFEVSIAAEAIHEMLQMYYSGRLKKALEVTPQ